jgi:ElaB/YqjD/DUF883 family membrane-anchored ribosome-binding protein
LIFPIQPFRNKTMFNPSFADQARNSAGAALDSAQQAAGQTLDAIDSAVDNGLGRVRESAQQVRERATHASQTTFNYIRHDPVKSVLIAAATGAALMALVGLVTRSANSR